MTSVDEDLAFRLLLSTGLSAYLWRQLPIELMCEILLIMASNDMIDARQLRLVSSDVNVLVLPIVFRHVILLLPKHVTQFTATLLPKRKNYIPALKSKLHIMPRQLSSYRVDSLVLVVNNQRPSIESAMASVGDVFCGLTKLAITCQNLSSNAFWLRKHPIHPKIMLLVHYGTPHLVNFYDPIFESVTHLYTCITHGHRYSTVADMPALTHLAVSTRVSLPATTALKVAASLKAILETCDRLQRLVLLMGCAHIDESEFMMWEGWLEGCMKDKRFILFPDFRPPCWEWLDIVNGEHTLWDRAIAWPQELNGWSDKETFPAIRNWPGHEWEIDLVQRDDYHPPEDDPDARGEKDWLEALANH
ncbi:hypothetical protein B0H34DRAFT_799143 [Crassisporium funariophilum]|nr:hypothetical protein B0H34DRAFT_799143 [Crassisporium funariophilum]